MTALSPGLIRVQRGWIGWLTALHRGDRAAPVLAAAVVAGSAGVLATSELGSGDYGQWLMTARPYLGEATPAYRDASAVPPVLPFLIALVARLTADRTAAIHVFAVLLMVGMALAAYLAATVLGRSRVAGAAAVVATLLLTDAYLELFAFGGLLQAGALMWLWLAVAAFGLGWRHPDRRWPWVAGAAAVGLGAMTHLGTASILLPATVAVAAVAITRVSPAVRRGRLLPLIAVLGLVAAYWLIALLPGAAELARNPASLAYRGPSRLWESLVGFWPTLALIGLALVGIAGGVSREVRRRRAGAWSMIASWTGVTLGVVLAAVAGGASTDYPRFVTPILAPLVVAAAMTLADAARLVRRVAIGRDRLTRVRWANVLLAIAVLASVPLAVLRFDEQIRGYALRDPAGLAAVASWVERNLPPDATVLAPVREGKWIEGLTGRAALFSSPIRYSFRREEWRRSIAADTLLRSAGAMVNPFFFARFTDDHPGTEVPRGLTIAANHGGEYLDLLKTVPAEAEILAGDGRSVLARQANLEPWQRDEDGDAQRATVTMRWRGDRDGTEVTWRQTVQLFADASSLEMLLAAERGSARTPFSAVLRPVDGIPLLEATGGGRHAELTFAVTGSNSPRLRITVGEGSHLSVASDGGIRVRSGGRPLRLLVTDLSASPSSDIRLSLLRPADVITRYGVAAAVVPRDSLHDARVARLEALGLAAVGEVGPYTLLQGATTRQPSSGEP